MPEKIDRAKAKEASLLVAEPGTISLVKGSPDQFILQTIASATHLRKHYNLNPIAALAELIWNGLDADATRVEVNFTSDDNLGMNWEKIRVKDNGVGIPFSENSHPFLLYGDSAKKGELYTESGRTYHGQNGQGRFKSLSLGGQVVWETIFEDEEGKRKKYLCMLNRDSPDFTLSRPKSTKEKTGTAATVSLLPNKVQSLNIDRLRERLVGTFALYLTKYRTVSITVNGKLLDPSASIKDEHEVAACCNSPWRLRAIEWVEPQKSVKLFLCDDAGMVLSELDIESSPSALYYSFYLDTDEARRFYDEGLELMHPDVMDLLDAVTPRIKDFIKQSPRERAQAFKLTMIEDGVYPYERPPEHPSDIVEQELFDEFAYAVKHKVGSYNRLNRTSKKLVFSLLKRVLEDDPKNLVELLNKVLDLSAADRKLLNRLLEDNDLARVVRLANLVKERQVQLASLKTLITDFKKETLETKHLHKFLIETNALWIFGEEYGMAMTEPGLTKVLKETLAKQKIDDVVVDPDPVKDPETGGTRRLDLLFTRHIWDTQPGTPGGVRRNLIIELKRPSIKLGTKEVHQVDNYLRTISSHPDFSDNENWEVWLIGASINKDYLQSLSTDDRETRRVVRVKNGFAYLKTWADVLGASTAKMNFLFEHLSQEASEDQVQNLFRANHDAVPQEAILPDVPD